jgi:hypothetical protein
MLKDKAGEPVFPKGALGRVLLIIFAGIASYFLHELVNPSEKPKVMPPELREAAAHCILTNDPKSCAIYEAAKPDYPIDPNRAGR